MGLVPILFMIYPTVMGIIGGTLIMLFMAKVPKPWALFILGMLSPLVMFFMGHTYIILIVSVVFIGLAEFMFRKGGFTSFKYNAISYGFFSCWLGASLMQILLVKERYREIYKASGMPDEYFNTMDKLISWPTMVLIILGAFVGGIIGAYLGKKMLKKHFEKAGIV